MKKKKIIAILGPTSSGKSDLAVLIAKKFNGEIISADSRQVYKNLNIGTGKVFGKWLMANSKALKWDQSVRLTNVGAKKVFVYYGISHHCIDFVNPKITYTVAQYKKCAERAISDIACRKKLPILCGGTGFYIDAVVYNQTIPEVEPNPKLRRNLERLGTEALYAKLKKLDPERAKTIDPHNPRRLVRAIEIVTMSRKAVPTLRSRTSEDSPYDVLWLGINLPEPKLKKRIHLRLVQRMRVGLIREVKNLQARGLSYARLYDLGLEYRYVSQYLEGNLTRSNLVNLLEVEIWHYAKRQMTWFKKNKNIRWIKNKNEAERLVKRFLV